MLALSDYTDETRLCQQTLPADMQILLLMVLAPQAIRVSTKIRQWHKSSSGAGYAVMQAAPPTVQPDNRSIEKFCSNG